MEFLSAPRAVRPNPLVSPTWDLIIANTTHSPSVSDIQLRLNDLLFHSAGFPHNGRWAAVPLCEYMPIFIFDVAKELKKKYSTIEIPLIQQLIYYVVRQL